ncbi:MAG: hypothetical protein LDL33_05965 [Desulfomonile sp.]|nr:hypothetical protein [Desulfomonile sp.]
MERGPADETVCELGKPPLKLYVRYCGGCDPEIDRAEVVERLQTIVLAAGYEVKSGCDDPDVILLVSGCLHACIEQEDWTKSRSTPCIAVQGNNVDGEYVPEARIHEVLWDRIKEALHRRRRAGRTGGNDRRADAL